MGDIVIEIAFAKAKLYYGGDTHGHDLVRIQNQITYVIL
ncbi:hypothetical protein JCM19314_2701 [Nonlabens ulvanivorans]|uniref:Uncharacterized protein n=1 Tax=Nonlabens ulvanivorans TaxID=906888 RepID=A0A090Q6N9_NONUL|nr:hypothetical protein JCM19314_2701 [Nonlabens ulvanivorans]